MGACMNEFRINYDRNCLDIKNNIQGYDPIHFVLENYGSMYNSDMPIGKYAIGRGEKTGLKINPNNDIGTYISKLHGVLTKEDNRYIYTHKGKNPASVLFEDVYKSLEKNESIRLTPSNKVNLLGKFPDAINIHV